MTKHPTGSNHSSKRRATPLSLWLVAAALCLGPPAASAGTLDPTDTATGTGALAHESGGKYNTADGASTLYLNTTGYYNTASGYNALYYNTTGDYNTASGFYALLNNTTGNNNTASGIQALYLNTAGDNNVAIGANALHNSAGSSNTAVGSNALSALTSGVNDIALGINAGDKVTTGSGNIEIGSTGGAADSHVTRIGTNQTKAFIAGIAGVPLSGATVVVKSNGQLGVIMSSARYKQDIQPLTDASDRLAQLHPVSFRYKTEPEATHYGLIAEEVDQVMPELVVRDEKNRPESVQYIELVPLLLQQWKAQQVEITQERALIERQQDRLKRQEDRLARQETELTELRQTLAARLAVLDGGDTRD